MWDWRGEGGHKLRRVTRSRASLMYVLDIERTQTWSSIGALESAR